MQEIYLFPTKYVRWMRRKVEADKKGCARKGRGVGGSKEGL